MDRDINSFGLQSLDLDLQLLFHIEMETHFYFLNKQLTVVLVLHLGSMFFTRILQVVLREGAERFSNDWLYISNLCQELIQESSPRHVGLIYGI